jgi:hypothetical protein
MLLFVLGRRFGAVSPELARRIRGMGAEQLRQLADVALAASSLDAIATAMASLPVAPAKAVEYRISTR